MTSETNANNANYALTDSKAILGDVLLETIQLKNEVRELHSLVQLLSDDLNTLTKSVNEFHQRFAGVKQDIADTTATVAAQAFDEQLRKVEKAIGRSLREQRRFFFFGRR